MLNEGIDVMDDVIDLAKQLMACPSVTPDDAGCQQLIATLLTQAGFHCEHMRFGETDNLWARIGTSAPLFVFAGHTDVVPPGPATEWQSPPFEPTIKNNLLYGRGASDMKAALAAMVVAAVRFVKEHTRFNGSLAFLITSDEEGAAVNGTEKVIAELTKRGEKIQYCVIGEPSSDKTLGDQIRIGRRGSLHGKLTIQGKQGHVALPHLADNPIHRCLNALDELCKTTWDNGNNDFPATSFQISNIHAGTGAANVIPGEIVVTFNLRFSTAVTVEQLKQRIEQVLTKDQLNYHIHWEIGGLPFLTKKGKLITATQAAIKQVTGTDTRLSTGGGTSDGRFIAPTGAEIVELGASNATAHQVNECVNVEDLAKLTEIYSHILDNIFKS